MLSPGIKKHSKLVTSSDLKGIYEFESGRVKCSDPKKRWKIDSELSQKHIFTPTTHHGHATVETFPRLRLHETDVLKILRVEAMNLWIPSSLMDVSGKCVLIWCLSLTGDAHFDASYSSSIHVPICSYPFSGTPPPQAHVTLATQAKLQSARCAVHSESAAPWADLRDTWLLTCLASPNRCSTSHKRILRNCEFLVHIFFS